MNTLTLKGLPIPRPLAQRQGRRAVQACLRLEALEERYAPSAARVLPLVMGPALVGSSTPVVTPAATPTPAVLTTPSSTTPAAVSTGNSSQQRISPAAVVSTLAPAGAPNSPTPGTAPGAFSFQNQLPAPIVIVPSTLPGQGMMQTPTFAIPTGFPGRLLFPNSGVNVRTPNGDGPMQAPPGIFAPGGGDQTQAVQNQSTLPPPRPLPPPTPVPGRIDIDLGDGSVPVSAIIDQQPTDTGSVDEDDLDFTVDPDVSEQPEP